MKMRIRKYIQLKDGGAFSLMRSNRNFLIQNVQFFENEAQVLCEWNS